ncbi:hypothetical protein BH23BAC1_BH23BAC1_46050 [soil metagenome]
MLKLKEEKDPVKILLPSLASLVLYIAIAYFLEREEFVKLFIGYTLLFIAYISLYRFASDKQVMWLIYIGIIFRLSLFLALPNLSDDFYRFIWDGRLFIQGIHPFSQVPDYYKHIGFNIPGITEELYYQLNSPEYFTIYPPVCQFIFAIAAFLSPESILGSVIIMRIFIIGAEAGTLFLLLEMLKKWNLPVKKSLLYALNPLVILELTGNLHFEAILIFFLLYSIYFIYQTKLTASAANLSLAISTKVLPLIFLPLFIRRLGWRKTLIYFSLIALFSLILFVPLLSWELIVGFSSSIALYFHTFEYNASIYYVIRALGFLIFGFNIIGAAGVILAVSIFILIIFYSLDKSTLEVPLYEAFMWVLLIYYLFTTTLHPWYITPLIALSIFTNFKFTILWSYFIFLTYINYALPEFQENLFVVAIEYLAVLGFLIYEFKKEKRSFFLKNIRF